MGEACQYRAASPLMMISLIRLLANYSEPSVGKKSNEAVCSLNGEREGGGGKERDAGVERETD